MIDQPTAETDTRFIPPAAANLPPGVLDSATEGADRLDASARTPVGRNFLAHALAQLARDGWLRTEPGDGTADEHRLRLAHKARRAKEHQLDGIRRALCDVGAMRDDDPYSHADLEDVIRQMFTLPMPPASGQWLRAGSHDLSIPDQPQEQQ
jgi:hypothetical protein